MPSSSQKETVQHLAHALSRAEQAGDIPLQIRLYQELLNEVPNLALAHAKVGHLYLKLDQPDSAQPYIEHALALPGDDRVDAELFDLLADRPLFTGNLEQAHQWYLARPNLWRMKLYAAALLHNRQTEQAEKLLAQMLESSVSPSQQAWVMSALAKLYFDTARYHEAIASSQMGLEIAPQNIQLYFNLAASLEQVGRYEQSFEHYNKVLQQLPQHANTHNNLALQMLRLKQFASGWPHYEWRWQSTLQKDQQLFNIPRWQGEPLEGKKLLVWAEQGIGDHIMFASMLPDLLALGGTLHFETYTRLAPILQRSFSKAHFIQREQAGTLQGETQMLYRQSWPQSDFQIPMGSLGQLLRPNLAAFAHQGPYLQADLQASQSKQEEYNRLFPGKKLIGLSWRGGIDTSNDMQSRRISMTELARLASLEHVQFINLQYGDTLAERIEAQSLGLYIHHDESVNPLADMDAQASQLLALDSVLSIDNTTVHLAGALGVPTYVLLQLNPNWRWGLEEGPSYWYPSVYLIRNREIGRWETALDRAVAAMRDNGHL